MIINSKTTSHIEIKFSLLKSVFFQLFKDIKFMILALETKFQDLIKVRYEEKVNISTILPVKRHFFTSTRRYFFILKDNCIKFSEICFHIISLFNVIYLSKFDQEAKKL